MPTDIQRIEELDNDVLDTTAELQNLQNTIDTLSDDEKVNKFLEIEQTIRLCKEEYKKLEQENEIENIERMNQLKNNLANLEQIYNEISQQISSQTNEALSQLSTETIVNQKQNQTEGENSEQELKGKKWIRWWRNWLTNWQKKWIRIWWWVLAWIWIFSLFRRNKWKDASENSGKSRRERRKERREARRAARKEKTFRDRPMWKIIKWTWIWTWAYYVVHWLSTGKWWLKDFFDWWNDKLNDSVSQVSAYEQLAQEQREQYEKLWDWVNDLYWKIWEKENSLWFEDKNQLWTISNKVKFIEWKTESNYKWLVPFCIDKDSNNIKEILSEKDLNEYFFNKNISELKNKLKWWSTEKLENFLWPYVNKLESFQVFGLKVWASLWEKIKDWLDYDSEGRDLELDFFFRQYSKVLVFLKDRETMIQYKIAENILKNTGYEWKSLSDDEDDKLKFIQEVLEDKEWFKANIENNDVYKNFMNSKLVGVSKILESQNISNWEISWELKNRLEDLDDTTDDVLQIDENNTTIVDRWLNEIWWWLSESTTKSLVEMCDDIQDDMADATWTWLIQEYFEWLTYICNTEENNKQKFLEESGLQTIVDGFSSVMNDFKEKINNKTITADDLQKLKQVSLEYLAMKKEIEVAMYTMKTIKDDDPDIIVRTVNSWFKLLWWFVNSVQKIIWWEWKFWDWLNIGISIAIVWWVVYVVKHPLEAGKAVVRVSVGALWAWAHAVGRAWWRTMLTSRWLFGRIDRLASKGVPLLEQKKYFLYFVLNGKASEENKLIKLAATKFGISADSGPDLILKMCPKLDNIDQAEMIWKYSWNKNLKKLYMRDSSIDRSRVRKRDVLFHNKATRNFEFDTNVLNKIKELDWTIPSMDDVAWKWMKKLLKGVKEVEDLETLKVLSKNEDFVNQLKTLNKSELKQFRRHLKEFRWEKLNKILTWELKVTDAVAPFMRNGVRQAANVTETATETISEARRLFNERINKEIAKIVHDGGDYAKVLENRVGQLKNIPLDDSEIKWFTKFLDEWFDVKYIRELKWLCDINILRKWGKPFWNELKELLQAWDYAWFKQLIRKPNNKAVNKALTKIDYDGLIKHIDDIAKFKKLWTSVWDDALKVFARVLSKIL